MKNARQPGEIDKNVRPPTTFRVEPVAPPWWPSPELMTWRENGQEASQVPLRRMVTPAPRGTRPASRASLAFADNPTGALRQVQQGTNRKTPSPRRQECKLPARTGLSRVGRRIDVQRALGLAVTGPAPGPF